MARPKICVRRLSAPLPEGIGQCGAQQDSGQTVLLEASSLDLKTTHCQPRQFDLKRGVIWLDRAVLTDQSDAFGNRRQAESDFSFSVPIVDRHEVELARSLRASQCSQRGCSPSTRIVGTGSAERRIGAIRSISSASRLSPAHCTSKGTSGFRFTSYQE